MNVTYLRLELKRASRNARFWIFSCTLPVILFVLETNLYGANKTVPGHTITYSEYLMCGLAAWGALNAAMTAGTRVAAERAVGWQRQLRLTPLRPSAYLLGKLAVGLGVALPPALAVSVAGAVSGVHLSAGGWVQVTLGIWLATTPFAIFGVLLGQAADPANVQNLLGFGLLLLGFLGGLLIPSNNFPAWLQHIVQTLPSYWLAEIGHGVFAGNGQAGKAALILLAWSVGLGFAVAARYRRDSARA